ncbi:MAG: hypothetical protein Q7T55_21785 [Solirubrobacteraceae bacterium]|nr:hypothetical protein [Solirubrobacteraceae bacterium]
MGTTGAGNGEPLTPVPAPTAAPRLAEHREAITRLQEFPMPVEVAEPVSPRRRKIRDQPPQVRRKRPT